jgi:hypothetical protein
MQKAILACILIVFSILKKRSLKLQQLKQILKLKIKGSSSFIGDGTKPNTVIQTSPLKAMITTLRFTI